MGASSSTLTEPLKGYKFPADRAKMRHVRTISGKDESVDKKVNTDLYDYVIIFSRPEDKGVGGIEATGQQRQERVRWVDVEQVWFQAVPGDEERKTRCVEWLRSEWTSRFRTDTAVGGDTIPRSTFESLVREHIVDVLGRRAGLQLKLSLSPNGDRVYCLVRAPASLLEKKAERIKYKLKFRGEVDPGVEFWQRWDDHDEHDRPIYVELQEEATLYEKNRANEVLEDLYAYQKIGANDAAVFEVEEPTKKHWSRRVHTLERIADGVPVTNRYPAYASFSTNPRERHLYEMYDSVRGPSIFLPKDRLYITKRLIDDHFDFGVLVENEMVVACFALHDAARGEEVTVQWFQRHWVFPWRSGELDACGAPYVSHPASQMGSICPSYLFPWAQPLMEIRAYFGEKIALYFAWVGFYGYSLLFPTLAALACQALLVVTGTSDESAGWHYDQIFLAFFLVGWAAYSIEAWEVECKYAAAKWGTTDFEEEEQDRPQFVGDDEQPRRLSPITNQNETYYPPEKRYTTQFCSTLCVFMSSLLLVLVVLLVFLAQYVVYDAGLKIEALAIFSVVMACLIQVVSRIYGRVAYFLNDQENYRTQTAYENNLTFKKFFFELFNNYAALTFTVFFKSKYFACILGNDNCLGDIKVLLIAILVTRYCIALYGVFADVVSRALGCGDDGEPAEDDEYEPPTLQHNPMHDGDVELGDVRPPSITADSASVSRAAWEAEINLEEYEGTFDDYAEIVLQMGLVTMFSLGLYVLPLFAMLETLLQIRVDAYKLTALTRRPDPNLAETVGVWGALMDAMATIAVLTNSGIICFATKSLDGSSPIEKIVVFFVLEQLMLAFKAATQLCVTKVPLDLYEIRKRQAFVVDRHKNVRFDYGEGDDVFETTDQKRGNVDRDNLKQAKTAKVLTQLEKDKVKWLQGKLKNCETDLSIARGDYRRASKSEVLREDLGVSYSRRTPDLALGMVTLAILEAENVGTRHAKVDAKSIRLVVHVRDPSPQRKYEGQPGPGPQVSKPARLPPKTADVSSEVLMAGQRLVFNQTFTLAPIKTAKAEIVIDIMDEARRVKLGSTTLVLSDLASQKKRALTLSVAKSPGVGSATDSAVLYVKAHFQYSRIIPIKRRIYAITDEQRKLQRDIQNIQLGNPPDYAWEFPEDLVPGRSPAPAPAAGDEES